MTNLDEERKPYQNDYRQNLSEEDASEETEEETDPSEKEATSFIDSDKSGKATHDYKKRYDDLKKHYDQKVEDFKKSKEEYEAKITSFDSPTLPAGATSQEMESFREDYPDVYKAMQTISAQQAEEKSKQLEEEIASLKEKEVQLIQEQAKKELTNAHPDFFELRETEEFLQWLEEQPASISNGITQNNTDSKWAVRVVDLYKADKGLVKSRKKQSKSNDKAADFVPTKNKVVTNTKTDRIWTTDEISRLRPDQFDKLEKEFWDSFYNQLKTWDVSKMRANDQKVHQAIIVLFESKDEIEIFNKKAIYLYLREITGLNTKQVVSSLNKFRVLYRGFKKDWESGAL